MDLLVSRRSVVGGSVEHLLVGWSLVVGDWWVGGAFVCGLVVGGQWVGGGPVGGLVEDLSLGQY